MGTDHTTSEHAPETSDDETSKRNGPASDDGSASDDDSALAPDDPDPVTDDPDAATRAPSADDRNDAVDDRAPDDRSVSSTPASSTPTSSTSSPSETEGSDVASDDSTSDTTADTPSNAAADTPSDATTTPSDATTTPSDAPDVSTDTDADVTVAVDSSPSRDRSSTDVDLDGVVFQEDGDDETESQGLFDDLLSSEPIFENKEVLRPSYTPHELPHRTDQINRMATILVSALRGDTPSNILIYGKTGTGKTASAKFVSNELETTSKKYDVPCEVEYINCEVTDTQYRVLAQLANKFIQQNQTVIADRIDDLQTLRSAVVDEESTATERSTAADEEDTDASPVDTDSSSIDAGAGSDPSPLDGTPFEDVSAIDDRIQRLRDDAEEMEEVPMTGWPTDRVYSTFFDAVDYHERVAVIMLDEIDKLVEKSGDDTLYNLSRMNSELGNSRISIMGISNDLKFTDFLDPRVKSSLGEEEIVFPPYDANQLRDILQHRADVAFKGDALTEDVIPLCAAFAAQEHGDARRALDLLRTAGELAERSQAEVIGEEHVRQAQDKIELDRVVEVVRTLPTQSKIVLFSIILLEKNGVHNINTGEVFNIYKRLCEEIDADVLTQRRVTDLISELDMLGIVNAVVVSKGRYGRTKEMSLSVPIDETEAVLLSDSRLGDIENAQPFVQARFDN
ncbi:ORC1-type DNA replication protein [Halopenitus sp. POP-27]|uniref:Cdc6/Cdc18 family protein n=1 Tax=Halopenitus sp. POP-27 TaxID=2994425 RepID=UPI00246990EF|nr:ORC1-type DNA replication protein [Halopenitus sp. POP-27]